MNRLTRLLADASIITKITLLYVLAIVIPSVSMTVFSYHQSRLRAEERIASTNARIFDEVHGDLLRAMHGAETVGDELSFNAELRGFLSRPFEGDAEAILEYTGKVSPIIAYALRFQGGDIDGIKVFYTSKTIPEYWVYFFWEDRLRSVDWYQTFKRSDAVSMWVYPNTSDVPSSTLDLESRTVVSYARKVLDPRRNVVGTIVVDLSAENLLSQLARFSGDSGCFAIIDPSGHRLIDACGFDAASRETIFRLARPIGSPGSNPQRWRDGEYSFRTIAAGDFLLVHRRKTDSAITGMALQQLMNVFVIIGVVFVLEAIAFFGLRVFFRRLRLITSSMNSAAEGNFQLRIPVTGRDEIGQITEDFNKMIGKIRDLVEENVRRETAQKNAQLMALQFQLNPHFIYNMIDTFRMKLVIEDTHEIADSLAHFGKMLRYNISASDPFATLGDEIRYVEQYLAIQRLRYEDRVILSSDIPKSDYPCRILRFVLQPVIENSIKHGLDANTGKLHIVMSGRIRGDLYEISVEDDGSGIEGGRLLELNESLARYDGAVAGRPSEGIGLLNTAERFHLYYGSRARIFLDSETACYARTTLVFPLAVNGGPHEDTDRR